MPSENRKSIPSPITSNIQEGRMPPQSIDAEMSVLGALMLDREAIYRVADILSVRDFYKPAHQLIYECMLDLFKRNEPLDVLSVSTRLREKGILEDIGGSSYLTSLVNLVPTASHVFHYAKITNKKRVLRDLIDASYHIAELGYKEEDAVEDLLDQAEQRVFAISQSSLQQEFHSVKDALDDAWERIDKLHKGDGAMRGVPTGFPGLDNITSGLQKSDLIILASRPSLGKTSLALDIARHAATKAKVCVGLFSLEMSREQVVDRLIAAQAGIDLWRLRNGRLSSEGDDNDFVRIRDAMEELSQAPIFIDDAAMPTVMQIRTMSRRLQAERGLDLIIVDYLQLIKGHDRAENRVQEVTEISRSLKALAKELNVPVLALSQLSRAVESRTDARPKLSDLRESGSLEQDADLVMFIYREDKAKKNSERRSIADILIEKHRNGPVGNTELFFVEEQASFRSMAKHYEA
ncbi:MAG: replicative DNA helicase [Candidatus Sungbacteria bacterium]|uniref:Replicative DNA helicase n=1 Tax=Candidatus Sungiibacteriota bacterium TaxID=2750080 RepID=A0A931SEG9_9BACT|nr:replicative DNA helicase [Candidatus Sungbacteria bacterium]